MAATAESGFELLHLVARAADGARPLAGRRACADLWPRLVAHFDVIACALMPDHVHLFARVAPEGALRTFAQILGAFRARAIRDKAYGVGAFEWKSLPAPGKVRRDPRHIGRAIRSVKRYRPLADPRRYFVVSPPDASLSMLADSVTRALRSPRSAPVTFDLAERRLYLLSAAKWTRYRATELARSIGSHPASVRRFLQGVHGAMPGVAHATQTPAVGKSCSTRMSCLFQHHAKCAESARSMR